MQIDINDVNEKLFRIIKQFSPFGPLNLAPIFISKSVIDSGYAKKIGADMSHLRINAKTKSGSISGIGFGMGHYIDNLKDCQEFDICYSIEENEWNGQKKLQLRLFDLRTHGKKV